MSRFRLIASLVIALAALVVAGAMVIRAFPLTASGGTPLAADSAPLAFTDPAAATPRPPTKNDADKVYKVGGDVTAPVPLFKPEPPYPPGARRDKVQGTVVLSVVVDAQGNVTDVRVAKSLRPDFDEKAVNTVSTWKFKPATRKGKAVPVRVSVEISFRMF